VCSCLISKCKNTCWPDNFLFTKTFEGTIPNSVCRIRFPSWNHMNWQLKTMSEPVVPLVSEAKSFPLQLQLSQKQLLLKICMELYKAFLNSFGYSTVLLLPCIMYLNSFVEWEHLHNAFVLRALCTVNVKWGQWIGNWQKDCIAVIKDRKHWIVWTFPALKIKKIWK